MVQTYRSVHRSELRGVLPTLVPLIIFSGYLIPLARIPWYFKWLYYASFFQYAFGVLQINELANRTFTRDCPAELVEDAVEDALRRRFPHLPPLPRLNVTCAGETYLRQQGLSPPPYGGVGGYLAILGGYCLLLQLAAYAVLARKVQLMSHEH